VPGNPLLSKIIIIYLMIGIFLSVAGGSDGLGVNNFISDSSINNQGGLNNDLANNLTVDLEESTGVSQAFSFFDVIGAIVNSITFLGGIVFALPSVLIDFQLPTIILQLVGFPLTMIGILSMIYFVRSGQ